ncbi:molybdopterin-dependent oxidoreductase [bacterium]|nr:molybdopterin-dependent oxidoreductase [Verrucomicrobiota bacterium]MDC0267802.1 molybdopterin-dependent oxidoreductase [bacterium]MDG1893137.1 molybdopterin-dependent oxidoreductase [Verrucomicrobiota bacterium]
MATDTKQAAGQPVELLTVKVDGVTVEVPKTSPDWQGNPVPTTILQACKQVDKEIPHYCYHPKLPVAGNCRMCLVEVGMPAMGRDRKPIMNDDGSPKIQKGVLPYDPTLPRGAIACATPVAPNMEIYTDSPNTKMMRQGVLESLLINHPLDCPICDQAGECKLQEYSLEHGQAKSQFVETKVAKPKQVDLGPRIILDDERCVLCTRCIRFSRDIVHDDALGIVDRGSYNTIAAYPGSPFDNNYTLNTVDLCPVGALTSKDFRFQMRVWFLKETKSICTSCSTGCNITVGSRENRVYRYEPRDNDGVNASWMCDHGRLNYKWVHSEDRLKECLIREQDGSFRSVEWSDMMRELSEALTKVEPGSVAIVASARATNEELFLIKLLANHFEAITDCVERQGEADDLLVQSDKNPNSNGVRALGIAYSEIGIRLPDIETGIAEGKIKTLLAFGEDVTQIGLDGNLMQKLDLIVVSDILKNHSMNMANFILPGCTHLEKRGSFINGKGRVQSFMKAVEPPGNARPDWEWLHALVTNLTGMQPPDNIPGLFNEMCQQFDAFKRLEWRQLGDQGVDINI